MDLPAPLGRAYGVVDAALIRLPDSGFEEVMSDLGGPGVAVTPLEYLGRAVVQGGPRPDIQLRVENLADQCVDEAETTARSPNGKPRRLGFDHGGQDRAGT